MTFCYYSLSKNIAAGKFLALRADNALHKRKQVEWIESAFLNDPSNDWKQEEVAKFRFFHRTDWILSENIKFFDMQRCILCTSTGFCSIVIWICNFVEITDFIFWADFHCIGHSSHVSAVNEIEVLRQIQAWFGYLIKTFNQKWFDKCKLLIRRNRMHTVQMENTCFIVACVYQ